MVSVDVSKGESVEFEFEKDVPKDPLRYVKTAVAFANTRGGSLVFGVDDSREVVGMDDPYHVADRILDTIMSMCEPQLPLDSYVEDADGRALVVIRVGRGVNRPYYISSLGPVDGTFVRVGATTRHANEERLRDLMSQGSRRPFDSSEYLGDSFDPGSVAPLCARLSKALGADVAPENLHGMGLMTDANGGTRPTNAFMLVTCNPFPHAGIKCVRFRGTGRGLILDSKEYSGDLVSQVESATGFVLNYLPLETSFAGIYRRESYEIPEGAVRELIMNAVIHRSYADESSCIRVFLYDDRLEVISPGPMPLGMTVNEAMRGRSKVRNPAVAGFFRAMGLSEGFGSGLMRVCELCEGSGLDLPVLEDDGDCVTATVRRNVGVEYIDGPSERDMMLLGLMEDDPSADLDTLSSKVGVSKATVSRMVRSLKDRGYLRREGAKNNGRWRVLLRPGNPGDGHVRRRETFINERG